jgi:hypothetical protein
MDQIDEMGRKDIFEGFMMEPDYLEICRRLLEERNQTGLWMWAWEATFANPPSKSPV